MGSSCFLAHLLPLLPAPSFLRPEWWEVARDDFLFDLPPSLSAQPRLNFERLFSALAALAWLALVFGHRLDNDHRRHLIRWMAYGGGFIAAGILVANLCHVLNPLVAESPVFTLFPNRNQTGLVLAVGCTMAFGLGLRSFHYHKTRESVMGFSLALLSFTSTLTLQGRAAPLLCLLGCFLITSFSGHTKDILRMLKVIVPLGLLAGTALFALGNDIALRLQDYFNGSPATDFRTLLMRDTGKLVLDQPLLGVGGGSFPAVFSLYRQESLTFQPVLHPESDWLWLAAEHGVVGLLGALVLSGSALACLSFQRKNRGETVTNIASICFLLIFLHSLPDGPFHRPGTILLAVLCLAAARQLNSEPRRSHRVARRLWQALGVVLVGVSAVWACAFTFNLPWYSEIALANSRLGPSNTFVGQPAEPLRQKLETALRFAPLDARAHFDLARLSLLVENNPEAAQMSYLRARFLEPHAADRFLQEGLDWAPTHPERAVSAWREALLGLTPYRTNLLVKMARLGRKVKGLKENFVLLTHTDRELRYHYLRELEAPEFRVQFVDDLRLNPALWGLSQDPAENIVRRNQLLALALRAGMDGALADHLKKTPELRSLAWPYYVRLARDDASRADAARLAYSLVTAPASSPLPSETSLAALREEFARNPADPAKLLPLLESLRNERLWNEILAALRLHADQPPSPVLAYFRAEALLRLNRATESCQAWDSFATLSRLIE